MLDTEIRIRLAQYLNREINLRAFQEWFFSETWDIHNLEPASILDIVYSIKLKLAEYTNGHLTEDGLREALSQYVRRFTIRVSFAQWVRGPRSLARLGASSRILHPEQDEPRSVVLA